MCPQNRPEFTNFIYSKTVEELSNRTAFTNFKKHFIMMVMPIYSDTTCLKKKKPSKIKKYI